MTQREQAEAVAKWCGWKPTGNRNIPWRTPSGFDVYRLPPYDDSLDAMRDVEDEIERRGLMGKYADALVGERELHTESEVERFLIRATAAQRLEAAYWTIQEAA
jgi:hypothetical protein